MLEINNIFAGYGRVPILNGLSLRLATGDFIGVLGHNGMGKTTLMRALMGLIPTWSGEVRLEGTLLVGMPIHARARRGMGYVPQGRRIFPRLTVKENLLIAAVATGSAAAVDQVIEELPQLKPLLARQGGLLSGGEQQILALGRCLVGNPRIVLLDEPTEGVQPSTVEQMAETLASLHKVRGLSMLLVEQNLDFIKSLSSRIVILEKGRITHEVDASASANTSELMAQMGFAEAMA
jgi:ABC-type branched-subunit amino acid transport system ATPase component